MLTDIFEQIEKGGAKTTQERRHPRHRRHRAAEAAARRRRPQPHQPVRVHGQQVRVPRRFGRTRASRSRTSRSTSPSPRRSTTWRPSSKRAMKEGKQLADAVKTLLHEADQGEQADHLQRQRLLRRVAEGGGQARPAEPAHLGRRLRRADEAGRRQGVREVRRAERARAARPLRRRARAVQQDHQHRGAADGADGQPLHPAGGLQATRAAGGNRSPR